MRHKCIFAFSVLRKLSCPDETYPFEGVIPFEKVIKQCSNSLQKVVVPAEYYFSIDPQIFHLRCLHFTCETSDFSEYLDHPSCVAQELVIESYNEEEYTPWAHLADSTPKQRWTTMISCFKDAQK